MTVYVLIQAQFSDDELKALCKGKIEFVRSVSPLEIDRFPDLEVVIFVFNRTKLERQGLGQQAKKKAISKKMRKKQYKVPSTTRA